MYLFVREAESEEDLVNIKISKTINNIINMIKRILNIGTIKKIDDNHYLYILPKFSIKRIKTKTDKKTSIIYSKDLIKKYGLKNNNCNKHVYYFIYEILKYIIDIQDEVIEEENIYVLSNEYNFYNLDLIYCLLDKFKTINIVTNNIKRYKELEDKIFEKKGILITVSNNKKRALKNANYIINLDFLSEEIKRYKVNCSAIILNCTGLKIDIPFHQGIVINDLEIASKKQFLKLSEYLKFGEKFGIINIYSTIEIVEKNYTKNYEKIIKKIESDGVKIAYLFGNNGIINKNEIKIEKKLLTK